MWSARRAVRKQKKRKKKKAPSLEVDKKRLPKTDPKSWDSSQHGPANRTQLDSTEFTDAGQPRVVAEVLRNTSPRCKGKAVARASRTRSGPLLADRDVQFKAR